MEIVRNLLGLAEWVNLLLALYFAALTWLEIAVSGRVTVGGNPVSPFSAIGMPVVFTLSAIGAASALLS